MERYREDGCGPHCTIGKCCHGCHHPCTVTELHVPHYVGGVGPHWCEGKPR